MSDQDLFNSGTGTSGTTDTPSSTSGEADLVSQLVGEGRKFKDVNQLAAGKLESDKFIERLQKENEELRKVADKNLTLETILDAIKKPAIEEQTKKVDNPPLTSAGDIDSIVAKAIERKRADERAAANLSKVYDTLVGNLGSKENAVKAIATRAKELGTSVEKLRALAIESPNAFFKLMDLKTVDRDVSVEGTVNTQALGMETDTGERTYAWYEKLRKTNPRLYMTPKIQNQMHKDAERLGQDKFMGRAK